MMAVPTTLHIRRPCMRCTPRPRPRAGGGGGAGHTAVPWAGRGGGSLLQVGGGAPTCVCAVPYCSVCAVLHRSVLHRTMRAVLYHTVLRTTLHCMRCAARHCPVHYAAPFAPCHTALCVQCRTALCCPPPLCLVHVSTGWRVWWVSCLRSQPPPRHLSRDNGGAAPAAPRPLRTYRSRCSPHFATAVTSQPLRGQPPPRYQSRGYRGAATATPRLQPTYSRCRSRCFAASLAPHLFCSTPSPRHRQGPMGLLLLQHSAAARAEQLLAVPCSSSCSSTAPAPLHGASWTPAPRHPTW